MCAISPKSEARTACVIGPKDQARTHGSSAPSGPYIQEVILPLVMVILGLYTIPWLDPKDMEPCAPSVPKAKLKYISHRPNNNFSFIDIKTSSV